MEKRHQAAQDLLSKLIAFDTSNLPGNERPCAEFLAEYLSSKGFVTEVQALPEDSSRANIIASIGNPAGKKLIYNGHIDVVPVSEGWTSDPFHAEVRDGKLYGRGTCDMKGGVAAMTEAAIALVEDGFDFSGSQLMLVFVCDEELHDRGIKHYIQSDKFVRAAYAVISEPSSLKCCIAHRGVVRYRLSILGKSCHAGVPSNGVNAIVNAGHAILALEALAVRIAQRTHPILPAPTLTPTVISGGTKDNIVPNQVDIQIDRRTLPDESIESCMAEIISEMEYLKEGNADFDYRIEPYVSVNAGYLSPEHPLVGACADTYMSLFGQEMTVCDFNACNDQSYFVNAGVPTLIFGPGNLEQAHTVDEYVPLDDIYRCTDFFYELAKKLLG